MAVQIVMPRLGDFMTEGIVARWAKGQGEAVVQGELVAEIESEKLNYELEATSDGILHHAVDEGATVGVDDVIGYLLAEGEEAPQPQQAAPTVAAARSPASAPQRRAPSRGAGDVVPSTPGARRLAASLGIDITQVTPTGPRGRVVDADVRAYHEQQQPKAPPGMPEPSKIEPLSGIRRSIAQNMRHSLSQTAQLSYFLEVDVTEAQRMRREAARESGVSINMASVLIKACAESLKRVPALNSILVDGNVMYFDEVNMGVAVALDDGLIVPVLKDVQDKSIAEIAEGVRQLSEKARAGHLSSSEIRRWHLHHQRARSSGRLYAHTEPAAERSARRGTERAKARCARRRDCSARDDDPEPNGRPPSYRRSNRCEILQASSAVG